MAKELSDVIRETRHQPGRTPKGIGRSPQSARRRLPRE